MEALWNEVQNLKPNSYKVQKIQATIYKNSNQVITNLTTDKPIIYASVRVKLPALSYEYEPIDEAFELYGVSGNFSFEKKAPGDWGLSPYVRLKREGNVISLTGGNTSNIASSVNGFIVY